MSEHSENAGSSFSKTDKRSNTLYFTMKHTGLSSVFSHSVAVFLIFHRLLHAYSRYMYSCTHLFFVSKMMHATLYTSESSAEISSAAIDSTTIVAIFISTIYTK